MTDDLKKSSEVENIYKILESGFQENKPYNQLIANPTAPNFIIENIDIPIIFE